MLAASDAVRPSSERDPGAPLAVPGLPPPSDIDMSPDSVSTLAEAFSKRAELLMLTQQSHQQELQLRMDRMKADFNAAQEQRSEALREMNALRDMAVEQSKKDDEILKKYIAMI